MDDFNDPNILAAPALAMAAAKRWPLAIEWDAHRARITALYKHHTAPQVQRIMAREHQFHASIRMYRRRLSAWGQDKNCKADEMQVIARKLHQEQISGNPAVFFVRGKPITYECAKRYYRRRGTHLEAAIRPERPSRAGTDKGESDAIYSGEVVNVDSPPEELSEASPLHAAAPRQTSRSGSPTPPGLPGPLSPPSGMTMPEQALRAMILYLRGSFDSRLWHPTTATEHFEVQRQSLQSSSCVLYSHMNKLYCQIRLACDLFNEHRYPEGGVFLRSSVLGVKELVESAYPPLPTFLPQMLGAIVHRGAPEVAFALLRQFTGFAEHYHGSGHPISRVCQLLGSISVEMLQDTISAMFDAVSDAFGEILGPLHRTALGARYGALLGQSHNQGPPTVVKGLRSIVDDCTAHLAPGDIRTTVFQLHLARWLLKPHMQPWHRIEAEAIMERVQSEASRRELDKEAVVLLAQAQIAAAEHSPGAETRRKEAMDRQLDLTLSCLICLCTDEDTCVVEKLFWPSTSLWEGKATLLGEQDGTLMRHFLRRR